MRSRRTRQPLGFLDGVGDRSAMRVAGRANVGVPAFERGDLRLAQLLAALDQLVVDLARVPVDLIDRPGDDGRLGKLANVGGVGAAMLLDEGVARGGELGQRTAIELIDPVVVSGVSGVSRVLVSVAGGHRRCYGCETTTVKFCAVVSPTLSKTATQ